MTMRRALDRHNMIIVPPTRLDQCRKLVRNRDWQWSFMGTDACLRERIIKELGASSRHCYARELQALSLKRKKPFVDWIANVGKTQDKPDWWATNIAYKNPLSSNLFLDFCCLSLIHDWKDKGVEKRIVVIENPWLVQACRLNFKDGSIHVVRDGNYFARGWLRSQLSSYAGMLVFLLRMTGIWSAGKMYSMRYREKMKRVLDGGVDVLFYTWIEERSFKGMRFFDPYLGNLADFYRKRNRKTATLTSPEIPFRLLEKAYRSDEIVPGIHFTGLTDIVESFFRAFSPVRKQTAGSCSGLDMTPLFECGRIQEKGRACTFILHYLTASRLGRNGNFKCRALIYPFENQPWDKTVVAGMNDSRSPCKVIAYQHTTIPSLLLNYFLGDEEAQSHPQPDVIVSNGEHWRGVLKNAGFSCPVENGGSVRYGGGKKSETTATPPDRGERDNNVLVLLSTSLGYSLDLLYYLLRASTGEKRYLVKPHPDTPEKVLKKYIDTLPGNFEFVGGSVEEWLDRVGWSIHVGTTATIECMMRGVNVFKYLPERIDMDPLLGMEFSQRDITDDDDLDFDDKWAFDPPDRSLIAEPLNERLWESFLT